MHRTMIITAFAATLGFVASAQAETFTWVGGGDGGNWGDSANWEDSSNSPGVPGVGDTAEDIPFVTFDTFDGHSVGNLIGAGSGDRINWNGASTDTFTFDNGGSGVTLSHKLNLKNGIFDFAEDATWTSSSFFLIEGTGKLTGASKLTIDTGANFWLRNGGAVELSALRLDDGEILVEDSAATDALANVDLSLATGTQILGDFTKLGGNNLDLDTGDFAAFSTGQTENWEVLAWDVGSTSLGVGTYDINSTDQGDADFSAIFAEADGLSVTVVPEPASVALLGLGGLAMLGSRRRKA